MGNLYYLIYVNEYLSIGLLFSNKGGIHLHGIKYYHYL
jgi:hypothetical protein